MMKGHVDRIKLYEEFRLIERGETEINGAWRGAHLLLFFLAFVFGCSCTFSFHILIYLFDEKCVLFPKLLSLKQMRQSVIYDFMPVKHEDSLPVDFVSTQWTDSSTCYLPTYVPLVSGIFGLVWTTMLLMCSSGNRTLTGLQRPWRILPPVFVFSLAMGGLSIYTSLVTHAGLQDLCEKLSDVTGSKNCAYTVNIVTLMYERRIRGVYQATRLTILTAWLHTCCWLLAALVALARVLLVVDFRLVRIQAELQGNIEAMLEHHERHIRTVSPDTVKDDNAGRKYRTATGTVTSSPLFKRDDKSTGIDDGTSKELPKPALARSTKLRGSDESVKVRFINKSFDSSESDTSLSDEELYYETPFRPAFSKPSLVPEEALKLQLLEVYRSVSDEHKFIVKMLFDLLVKIEYMSSTDSTLDSNISIGGIDTSYSNLIRQPGKISALAIDAGSARPFKDTVSTTAVHVESSLRSLPTLGVAPGQLSPDPRKITPETDDAKKSDATLNESRNKLKALNDNVVTQVKEKSEEKSVLSLPKTSTESVKASKLVQTSRPTGAVVVPRRKLRTTPKPEVTQSARLATKTSSHEMPKETKKHDLDAKKILKDAIKVPYSNLEFKKKATLTETQMSDKISLHTDHSSELISESQKTLTPNDFAPAVKQDDINASTERYQGQKEEKQKLKIVLLDDHKPSPLIPSNSAKEIKHDDSVISQRDTKTENKLTNENLDEQEAGPSRPRQNLKKADYEGSSEVEADDADVEDSEDKKAKPMRKPSKSKERTDKRSSPSRINSEYSSNEDLSPNKSEQSGRPDPTKKEKQD